MVELTQKLSKLTPWGPQLNQQQNVWAPLQQSYWKWLAGAEAQPFEHFYHKPIVGSNRILAYDVQGESLIDTMSLYAALPWHRIVDSTSIQGMWCGIRCLWNPQLCATDRNHLCTVWAWLVFHPLFQCMSSIRHMSWCHLQSHMHTLVNQSVQYIVCGDQALQWGFTYLQMFSVLFCSVKMSVPLIVRLSAIKPILLRYGIQPMYHGHWNEFPWSLWTVRICRWLTRGPDTSAAVK